MSQKTKASRDSVQIRGDRNKSTQFNISLTNFLNWEIASLRRICEALKNFFLEKDKEIQARGRIIDNLRNQLYEKCQEYEKAQREYKKAQQIITTLLKLPEEDRTEQFIFSMIEKSSEFIDNEAELASCRAASDWVKLKKNEWAEAAKKEVLKDRDGSEVLNSDEKITVFYENISSYLEWLRVALSKGHVEITSISLEEIERKSQENNIANFVYKFAFNCIKTEFIKGRISPGKLSSEASDYLLSFLDSLISIF